MRILTPRLTQALSPLCPFPVSTPLRSFPTRSISVPPLSQMDNSQLRMTQTGRAALRNQGQKTSRGQKEITSGKGKKEWVRTSSRWRSVRVWTLRWQSCRNFSTGLQRPSARTMKMKWKNCKTGALHTGSNKMNDLLLWICWRVWIAFYDLFHLLVF